jgi:hypothetical protein
VDGADVAAVARCLDEAEALELAPSSDEEAGALCGMLSECGLVAQLTRLRKSEDPPLADDALRARAKGLLRGWRQLPDKLAFMYKSADKAPGSGVGESAADPDAYAELRGIPRWRSVLSHFHEEPFSFEGRRYKVRKRGRGESKEHTI